MDFPLGSICLQLDELKMGLKGRRFATVEEIQEGRQKALDMVVKELMESWLTQSEELVRRHRNIY